MGVRHIATLRFGMRGHALLRSLLAVSGGSHFKEVLQTLGSKCQHENPEIQSKIVQARVSADLRFGFSDMLEPEWIRTCHHVSVLFLQLLQL